MRHSKGSELKAHTEEYTAVRRSAGTADASPATNFTKRLLASATKEGSPKLMGKRGMDDQRASKESANTEIPQHLLDDGHTE